MGVFIGIRNLYDMVSELVSEDPFCLIARKTFKVQRDFLVARLA